MRIAKRSAPLPLTLSKRPKGARRRTHRSTSRDRAGDLLHLEAFDDVADLDVVVILEGHAALVAFLDLAHLVLEALERLQAAFVDDHVVAQQAHSRAALHRALGHHAARDL